MMTPTNPKQNSTRRGFLDWMIAFCSVITGLAMTIPGLMYLWPVTRKGGSENVEVQGANNLQPGESITMHVGGKAVIVVRQRDGFKAFSAICTHLGCLVRWDTPTKKFLCPCHAATFDADGGVVSGPPPAPLPIYSIKEVGEKVFVSAA